MAKLVLVNRYFFPDESATSQLLADMAFDQALRRKVVVLCSRQLLESPKAALPGHDCERQVAIRRVASTRFGRASLPGRVLDTLSFTVNATLWLLVHLRPGDVVVAKTDPPLISVAVAVAARLRRSRLVNWVQDIYPEIAAALAFSSRGRAGMRGLRILRNWSLRQSRLNVTVSPGMSALLQREAGVSPICIPNWADEFTISGAESSFRRSLGLQHRFVIGYSGNLGRAHPIQPLLNLASELPGPPFHFLLSGGGVNFEALRREIEARKYDNWTFLPYQPRAALAELLAAADLHVVLLDPRLEQLIFPSKLYGILSAARPVLFLGDPSAEVAQVVHAHGCGWVVSGNDTQGMGVLVQTLAQNRDMLAAAGRNGHRAFGANYSKKVALAAWERALGPFFDVGPAGGAQ